MNTTNIDAFIAELRDRAERDRKRQLWIADLVFYATLIFAVIGAVMTVL